MSLDHDLDNLPRIDDETLEALDNPYIVIPALQSDEALAARDAADPSSVEMERFERSGKLSEISGRLSFCAGAVAVAGSAAFNTDTEEGANIGSTLRIVEDALMRLVEQLDELELSARRLAVMEVSHA